MFKPPMPVPPGRSIFLAGSIEMGAAEDWQQIVTDRLSEFDVNIVNPRRDDWDSSWEQTIEHPEFRGQVEYELNELEHANIIIVYLDPNTKSPISLLEIGLFHNPWKMVVCCPPGFWRKGNVDIVCKRYGVTMVESLDEAIDIAIGRLWAEGP